MILGSFHSFFNSYIHLFFHWTFICLPASSFASWLIHALLYSENLPLCAKPCPDSRGLANSQTQSLPLRKTYSTPHTPGTSGHQANDAECSVGNQKPALEGWQSLIDWGGGPQGQGPVSFTSMVPKPDTWPAMINICLLIEQVEQWSGRKYLMVGGDRVQPRWSHPPQVPAPPAPPLCLPPHSSSNMKGILTCTRLFSAAPQSYWDNSQASLLTHRNTYAYIMRPCCWFQNCSHRVHCLQPHTHTSVLTPPPDLPTISQHTYFSTKQPSHTHLILPWQERFWWSWL